MARFFADLEEVGVEEFTSFISGAGYERKVYFQSANFLTVRYYDDSGSLVAQITAYFDDTPAQAWLMRVKEKD